MQRLSTFEAYALAVVAMDRDYEILGTVQPFMSARFGRRGYPRAVARALKSLESKGLISGFRLRSGKKKDRFVRQPLSFRARNSLDCRMPGSAYTPRGAAQWRASGVRERPGRWVTKVSGDMGYTLFRFNLPY